MPRFLRFNVVGAVGFALQLGALALLLRVTPLHPDAAVAVAVLVTLTHNFFWHERYTWPGLPQAGRLRRWAAFNLSNGAVSLAVNLALTAPIASIAGIPIVAANAAAVIAASVVNFTIGDRVVFARAGGRGERRKETGARDDPRPLDIRLGCATSEARGAAHGRRRHRGCHRSHPPGRRRRRTPASVAPR